MRNEKYEGLEMEILAENKCFGGTQGVYRHASKACQCDMTFAVFLPEQAAERPGAGSVVFVWVNLHA